MQNQHDKGDDGKYKRPAVNAKEQYIQRTAGKGERCCKNTIFRSRGNRLIRSFSFSNPSSSPEMEEPSQSSHHSAIGQSGQYSLDMENVKQIHFAKQGGQKQLKGKHADKGTKHKMGENDPSEKGPIPVIG